MRNVILLTIDALRKDALGCYGAAPSRTPFIDSLAARAIRFDRCQSVGPYTQASFPGILTGSYYFESGLRQRQLSPQRTIVSEPLKQNGIATAGFHSNPYMCGFFGWDRGWDMFYDSMEEEVSDMVPYMLGNTINTKALEWLGAHVDRSPETPFFLWAHYMDVHEPYVPGQSYVDCVDPTLKMGQDEMFALFKSVILPRDATDPGRNGLLRKLYDAHVLEVDNYVRGFFARLDQLGLRDNTVVIITSDHGDEFGEHGGLSHDGKMISELINVPLLVVDPEIPGATVCDTVVSGIDIPQTILHLFGMDRDARFRGESLLPLDRYAVPGCYGEAIGKLTHKMKDTDQPVFFYQEEDLRIVHRVEGNSWQLYDLGTDPGQQTNTIADAPVAEEMKEKLEAKISEAGGV